MPLTPEQKQKASKWLDDHGALRACTCGATDWALGEIVVAANFAGSETKLEGKGVPMLQVACNNCARIEFYVAGYMGIV